MKLFYTVLLKGIVVCMAVFCCHATKAQFVTIPDPEFANWLNQNFPAAMSGADLDTGHVDVVSMSSLTIQFTNIENLEGIQYFTGLSELYVNYNTSLTSLGSALPPYLVTLQCEQNQLTSLPPLPQPSYLQNINCSYNVLTDAGDLTAFHDTLDCSYNNLTSLNISDSILVLRCSYNFITQLPSPLTVVKQLDCKGNQINSLSVLVSSLSGTAGGCYIDCSGNGMATLDMPNLTSDQIDIRLLNCSENNLVCLPAFSQIETVNFNNTGITCIGMYGIVTGTSNPDIYSLPLCPPNAGCATGITPAGQAVVPDAYFRNWLQAVGYNGCLDGVYLDTACAATVVPTYTVIADENIIDLTGIQYCKLLTELYCAPGNIGGNPLKLKNIPALPAGLVNLTIDNTQLQKLPELPLNTLRQLRVTNNYSITKLPELPYYLENLICSYNQLDSLPALPDNYLQDLDCSNNRLTTLPALPNTLVSVSAFSNQLTTLPALPDFIDHLSVQDNKLASLPALPQSLTYLDCSANNLSALPVLPDTLMTLSCDSNHLTALPALPQNLQVLSCSINQLTSLPSLPQGLISLGCGENQLNSLPALPAGLSNLYCKGNNLSALPALPAALTLLDCSYNHFSLLPALPGSLTYLDCSFNQLSTLPAIHSRLTNIAAHFNNLTSIPELPDSMWRLYINNNTQLACLPRLTTIENFAFAQTAVNCLPNYGNIKYSDRPLNPLPLCGITNQNGCTLYSDISGIAYYDANNSCAYDSGDTYLPNVKVLLYKAGVLQRQMYTAGDGRYGFGGTIDNTYTVKVDTSAMPFVPGCSGDSLNITVGATATLNADFAFVCAPQADLGVTTILPLGQARPGREFPVNLVAGNLAQINNLPCTGTLGGQVQIIISGPADYNRMQPGALSPATVSGDTLTWNVPNFDLIDVYQAFNMVLLLPVNATAGSSICITATISSLTPDLRSVNNIRTHCEIIVNSYDPNDKAVSPAGNIDTAVNELTYTVRFQNTGTASAIDIYIMDTLDSGLDPSSFELLASSHTGATTVTGNIIRFDFPNINLPDSNADEPGSHGYVQFKVKRYPGAMPGTNVENTAHIYFDFNAPVVTNTVTTGLCVPYEATYTASIIAGDTFSFYGQQLTVAGTYNTQFANVGDCDSVITLNLNVQTVCANCVFIPDSAFVQWLTAGYPNCMSGPFMDTTCNDILNAMYPAPANAGISNLTGIQYFKKAYSLYCDRNLLTALPILPPSLKILICHSNKITALPALWPDSLFEIACHNNEINDIPAFPALLRSMSCSDNNLTVLPVLPNSLLDLACNNNNLTVLPALNANLNALSCQNNPITAIPTLPASLRRLTFSQCAVNVMPVLPDSLQYLDCGRNNFTSLPASLPKMLEELWCAGLNLTTLPALPATLYRLYCPQNKLTELPPLPVKLAHLICEQNRLTSLPDLPDSLYILSVKNNTSLTCLPEVEIVRTLDFTNTAITCLPNQIKTMLRNPPGNFPLCDPFNAKGCPVYWNVAGKAYYDINGNCVFDSTDKALSNVKLDLYSNGILQQQVITGNEGLYSFKTTYGSYMVQSDTLLAGLKLKCAASGTYNVQVSAQDSMAYDNDFAFVCNPGGIDVGVSNMHTPDGLRPGYIFTLNTTAGNLLPTNGVLCDLNVTGQVRLVLSGPVVYSAPAVGATVPTSVTGDTIIWAIADFSAINSLQAFNILVQVDTTAQLGDQVCATATVIVNGPDLNLANNTLTYCMTVANSFDPNDKQVSPAGNIDTASQWLTYTIRFQNTGNAPAINIVVLDTLDAGLDASTFEQLVTSHNSLTQVIGNVIHFNFANINLADSNTNEPASHGYAVYRIQRLPNTAPGSSITNTAYIYFDFNAPIATNTVTTGVCTDYYDTIYARINVADSLNFYGQWISTSGTYTYQFANAGDCDSIITLNLTTTLDVFTQVYDTICRGEEYEFGGDIYTTAGVYTDTLPGTVADSIITLYLAVLPTASTQISDTICNGQTYMFGTKAITQTGFYYDTLQTTLGCDSAITLYLFVADTGNILVADTICMGETFTYNGKDYTTQGTYYDTTFTGGGCYITAEIQLTVSNGGSSTVNDTICSGGEYDFFGTIYTQTGTYYYTVPGTPNGVCDSVVALNLYVTPALLTNLYDTICSGNTYTFGNQTLSQSGVYYDTLNSAAQCDSVVILNLHVAGTGVAAAGGTICHGDTFTFNSHIYTEAGIYFDTTYTSSSCFIITTVTVDTLPAVVTQFDDTICSGDAYLFGTQIITQTGTYYDSLQTTTGCDSVVILNLYVADFGTTVVYDTICPGDSYILGTTNLTQAGIYNDTAYTGAGCYVVTTLHLALRETASSSIYDSICSNESYDFFGTTYTLTGTYYYQVPGSGNGSCDSVVILNLHVNPVSQTVLYDTICSGSTYLFASQNISQTGVYYDTLQNVTSCDSVVILNLYVANTGLTFVADSICAGDVFTYNNRSYTQAGTYYDTTYTGGGCFSVVAIELTVLPLNQLVIYDTICNGDEYLLPSFTLTQSGTYYDTIHVINGCDTAITLYLHVRPDLTTTIYDTICQGEPYMFAGQNRTSTGSYQSPALSVHGCDSSTTLHLYVIPTAMAPILRDTICSGASYQFGGQALTQSGVYYDTLQASTGCDSVRTLELLVYEVKDTAFSASICAGRSFTYNNHSYTQAGVHLDSTLVGANCYSIATITLTILPAATTALFDTVCLGTSYLFGGEILTQAGVYHDTLQAANGCDSIVTMNLAVRVVDTSVTLSGIQLTAAAGNTIYQWLDCSTNQLVNGASGRTFTPLANGSYAAVVINQQCRDTSSCYQVTGVGISNVANAIAFTLMPNPADDYTIVTLNDDMLGGELSVTDMAGRLIAMQRITETRINLHTSTYAVGMYLIRVTNSNGQTGVNRLVVK